MALAFHAADESESIRSNKQDVSTKFRVSCKSYILVSIRVLGGIAQLVERLVRNEKVRGSNPLTSKDFAQRNSKDSCRG